MIELKPHGYATFRCPECSSGQVNVKRSVFAGNHTLAEIECGDCALGFFQDYPVSHALYYPVTLRKDTGKVTIEGGFDSFRRHLEEDYASPRETPTHVERIQHKRCSKIVLLNCLDDLYGHVLLKLFNAQYYLEHEPEIGLVVLIPKKFEWLVPDGVAELWSVDLSLQASGRWHRSLDAWVQNELQRFEKVYLSLAFSHPDPSAVDITRFSRVKPFDLRRYYEQPFQVTFISRDDRLWFSSPLEDVAYRVARRLPVKRAASELAVERQDRRFEQVAERVAQDAPDVQFSMVGLGKPAGFRIIDDHRTEHIDRATELAYCQLYARSHVVVGVHGSNMLLPTAHAAGYVEILPHDRLGNLMQDVFYPARGRLSHLRGRFVGERAEPGEVAEHVLSMYQDFGKQRVLMEDDFLKHGRYRDATRWQEAWRRANARFDDVLDSEQEAV